MNADGSEPNALTDIAVRAKQPIWSPDGEQIAFVLSKEEEGHNLDIYLMDEDGSSLVRLTDFDSIEVDPRGRQMGRKSPSPQAKIPIQIWRKVWYPFLTSSSCRVMDQAWSD